MKKFIVLFRFAAAASCCIVGLSTIVIAAQEVVNDFDYRIDMIQQRIDARQRAKEELEQRNSEKIHKEASNLAKKTSQAYDKKIKNLQQKFKHRKEQRARTMADVAGELQLIQSDIGDVRQGTTYDRWIARQERKAEKLRKKIQNKRKAQKLNLAASEPTVQNLRRKEYQEQRRKRSQERLRQRNEAREKGDFFYLHLAPTWPMYAALFPVEGQVSMEIGAEKLVRSFADDGGRQDLSVLEYADEGLVLKDLVPESRLLVDGLVDDHASWTEATNPLRLFADSPITIESTRYEVPCMLGATLGILNSSTFLSVGLPMLYHHRRLGLNMTIPSNVEIPANLTVPANIKLAPYASNPNKLLQEIFAGRGLDFGGIDSGFVSSQFQCSLYRKFISDNDAIGILGLLIGGPFYTSEGTSRFEQSRIDDRYFYSAGLFAGGQFEKSDSANPHGFIQARFFFPRHVERRIAHVKSHDGTGTLPLALTTFVRARDDFSNVIDSSVALFAEKRTSVKVTRRFEFEARLGNQFREVFGIGGMIDLFYRMHASGQDGISLSYNDTDTDWDLSSLRFANQGIEHSANINWSYQADERYTVKVGGLYTFAGQNVPERFGCNLKISAEF